MSEDKTEQELPEEASQAKADKQGESVAEVLDRFGLMAGRDHDETVAGERVMTEAGPEGKGKAEEGVEDSGGPAAELPGLAK